MARPQVMIAVFALALALPKAGDASPAAQLTEQVTLPLPRYESLRERANPAPEPVPPPPAPFAFEIDDLEVRAGATAARVVQDLTLTLYSGDWQTVTLGEAGSFLSAQLGDLEGRVVASGNGLGDLHVRGQGRHRVRLESVVAVARDETSTRPTWRFALRLPPAAVVRGSLAPAPDLVPAVEELELAGGMAEPLEGGPAAGRAGGAGRAWTFAAPPGAALQVTLLGKPTLPARARLPLRFAASAATAAVISRTQVRVHGWVEARVAQGRLADLTVALPAGFQVVSANGPLAAWKVAGGKLVLTPREPVEDTLAVEVELKGMLPETFTMPLLEPSGAARTTLLAKAAVTGDGVLRLQDPGSSRPADEGEQAGIGLKVRQVAGPLYRVADSRRPPRWQLEWADHTAVLAAEIDGLWVEVVAGDAGRAGYQLWAMVRNQGAQQLAISLPAGFELVEASREGQLIVPGVPAAGAGFVVPLLTREAPQLIYFSGLLPLALPRAGGELLVPLPALSAPAARVEARLLLPAGRSYVLADPTRAAAGRAGPPMFSGVSGVSGATGVSGVSGASRATGISGPPGASGASGRAGAEPTPASAIGRELLSQRGPVAGVAARPIPRPAGFAELLASWSALSANPAPLAVRVKGAKEDNPWF